MIKKLLLILVTLSLTSCATIKEKMPNVERKACTDEKAKTLADLVCKKQ
tara:strand:+ start:344 stop:490 length:147 start_codon:yes stop_codon:yes gene_type:complete